MRRKREQPSKPSKSDSERAKHRVGWERRVLHTYGLTPEDVARKWDAQKGLCSICLTPLDDHGKVWVIDHNHKTGAFRGLLHSFCNHRLVSMIERGGFIRWFNTGPYLWGEGAHSGSL